LNPEMLAGTSTMPMCAQKIMMKKVGINRGDRYRLLAVVEPDEYKAAVLRRMADEADRNVLWTADRILTQPKQSSLHRSV
jgi:hypothetical protein